MEFNYSYNILLKVNAYRVIGLLLQINNNQLIHVYPQNLQIEIDDELTEYKTYVDSELCISCDSVLLKSGKHEIFYELSSTISIIDFAKISYMADDYVQQLNQKRYNIPTILELDTLVRFDIIKKYLEFSATDSIQYINVGMFP